MSYYQPGTYRAEVLAQGLSASTTGKPQFWLQVKVLESLDVNPVEVAQYDRTIYWTITEGTVEFVVEKLERLGFAGTSFKLLDPNQADHHSFVGQQIDVYCKLETYEGTEREKWDLSRYSGGAKPAAPPLDDSEARKLDALFGKKLAERFKPAAKAAAKPKGKPKAEPVAVAAESNSEPVDDDIPF